jgi:hypothetical protein
MTDWFVITLDAATPAQREAVHAAVEASTTQWWHHFADIWIVSGKSAGEWARIVLPHIGDGHAAVLVLPTDVRTWTYYGPDAAERCKWLHAHADAAGTPTGGTAPPG